MSSISQYGGIFVLILLFVLMYFLMIRPQKKQQKKHQETLSSLKKGDHVVTIGRLHGIVDEIDNAEHTVTLDCDGIYLVFDLNAIASVKPDVAQEAAAKATAAPAKKDNAKTAAKKSADEKTAAAKPAEAKKSEKDDSAK